MSKGEDLVNVLLDNLSGIEFPGLASTQVATYFQNRFDNDRDVSELNAFQAISVFNPDSDVTTSDVQTVKDNNPDAFQSVSLDYNVGIQDPLPSVTADDPFDIDVSVENTGDTSITNDLTITINGEDRTEADFTVAAGATETHTFSFGDGMAADNYDISVDYGDDSATQAFDVVGLTPTSIDASSYKVTEGNDIEFTVQLQDTIDKERTLEYSIEGVETSAASAADPVDDLGLKNGSVTVEAGASEAIITLNPTEDGTTEGLEAFKVNVLNNKFEQVLSSDNIIIEDPENAGQNKTLTTDVDEFSTGEGNDTFNALIDGDDTTFNNLDSINGDGGTDTLKLNVQEKAGGGTGAQDGLPTATVENIDKAVIRAAVELDNIDTSIWTGLQQVDVTRATDLDLESADTTDVNVSGVTGGDDGGADGQITIDGGKNIVVDDGADENDIEIGSTTVNNGTIDVTDSAQGTGAIAIDGGTDVTVNATSEDIGAITVGDTGDAGNAGAGTETDIPTGAINITQNLVDDGTGAFTGGAIQAEGGSSIDITVNGNSTAEADNSNADITVGTITATGYNNTTDVTVTQNDNSEQFTSEDEGGNTETASVQFGEMKEGDALKIAGLTFTASKDLTAEEVAQAFSDLTATDYQDDGGPVANGIYSGLVNGNWTSGAADGDTVVFTNTTANNPETDLDAEGDYDAAGVTGGTAPTVTTTDGEILTNTGTTSTNSTVFGQAVVQDGGDNSLTTVTVDGYATGSTLDSDVLESLTLRNGEEDATFTVTDTTAGSLDFTVDNITGGDGAIISMDGGTGVTGLTINAENEASDFELTASNVTDLTINAAADLTLDDTDDTDLTAVETADINGAGAVDMGNISGNVPLDSFNASDNTGGVTATVEATIDSTNGIDGDLTEYVFSAGDDTVTTVNGDGNTVETDITLGDGDDKLTLATGTTDATATLAGGAGTNTLGLAAADAADDALSTNTTFEGKLSGFSKLEVGEVATNTQNAVDLDNLDDISYVISNGDADEAHTVDVDITVNTALDAANTDDAEITINGQTFTAENITAGTGGGDDADAIADALAAAINADPYTATYTATASADDSGVLTITADTAGALMDITGFAVTGTASDATSTNATTTSLLTLDNMADGGTIEMVDAGTGAVVNMTDASGSSDSLNVVADAATAAADGSVNLGTLNVDDVETVSITAVDTVADDDGNGTVSAAEAANLETSEMILSADTASTVAIDGAAHLNLSTYNDSNLTTVDATGMTGDLDYTAAVDNLEVNGGEGDDTLTAGGDSNVINGGEGDDTLVAGDLAELTGGLGDDTYEMAEGVGLTKYATITEFNAGDTIDVDVDGNGTYNFISSELTFASTSGFEEIVHQAIDSSDAEDVQWFTFEGDTYILVNESDGTGVSAYDSSQDSLIQLTGGVDLSEASFNDAGTLEMA